MRKSFALTALLVWIPFSTQAEVHKCIDGIGHTTYQDAPCADGTSETVNINNLTIIPPPSVTARAEPSVRASPVPRLAAPYRNQHQTALELRNSRVKTRARYPLRRGW